jgi:hypothetical protein
VPCPFTGEVLLCLLLLLLLLLFDDDDDEGFSGDGDLF